MKEFHIQEAIRNDGLSGGFILFSKKQPLAYFDVNSYKIYSPIPRNVGAIQGVGVIKFKPPQDSSEFWVAVGLEDNDLCSIPCTQHRIVLIVRKEREHYMILSTDNHLLLVEFHGSFEKRDITLPTGDQFIIMFHFKDNQLKSK